MMRHGAVAGIRQGAVAGIMQGAVEVIRQGAISHGRDKALGMIPLIMCLLAYFMHAGGDGEKLRI